MIAMTDRKPRTSAALTRHQKAKQRAAETLDALHEAIVDDLDAGVPQAELVRITGYSREHIRKIAKAIREARK